MSGALRGPALAVASVLLAGCVSVPIVPAVTSYSARSCAGVANLGGAIDLTPQRRQRSFTVTTPVDGSTPCLGEGAAATPYLVFALPAEAEGTVLEVGARIEAARIFSPEVAVLDADGNQVRAFTADQYLFRGELFSVQFAPQPGERFVRVTADPARIGREHDAIAISTSTTYIGTPYGVATWTNGVDRNVSRTFSWEGAVVAVVHSPERAAR